MHTNKLFSKPLTKVWVVFIIVSVFATVYFVYLNYQALDCTSKLITVDGNKLSVCVADTPKKQQNGLSGYKKMNDSQGMIFIFDQFQNYSFWMKDMNFPIDIIWISQNHIVQITDNVPAQKGATDQDLASYRPSVPVDKVLEVNAGWSKRMMVNVGDKIEILDSSK